MKTEQTIKTEASVSLKAIRCGCTPEQREAPDAHAKLGKPCPNPRSVEDQGVVANIKRGD